MIVMAFAISPERLRIIEHNRRFYPGMNATVLFEHSMELISQVDYLYAEKLKNDMRLLYGSHYPEDDDDALAYAHVSIMCDQVREGWNKEYSRDWAAGQARMRQEMGEVA